MRSFIVVFLRCQPQQDVDEAVLVLDVVLLVVDVVAELDVEARIASVTSV
ncbi:hypothetical protein GCM10009557_87940 [Virgisporangium ochraceum]